MESSNSRTQQSHHGRETEDRTGQNKEGDGRNCQGKRKRDQGRTVLSAQQRVEQAGGISGWDGHSRPVSNAKKKSSRAASPSRRICGPPFHAQHTPRHVFPCFATFCHVLPRFATDAQPVWRFHRRPPPLYLRGISHSRSVGERREMIGSYQKEGFSPLECGMSCDRIIPKRKGRFLGRKFREALSRKTAPEKRRTTNGTNVARLSPSMQGTNAGSVSPSMQGMNAGSVSPPPHPCDAP